MENDFAIRYPHNSYPRETPCSALAAGGVYRGLLIGGAYGVFFGSMEVLTAPVISKDLLKSVGKNMLIATGGFACALGTYSSMECTVKVIRGKQDFLNSTMAGFVTGGLFGYFATRSAKGGLSAAIFTATAGSIFGMVNKNQDVIM